MKDNYFQMLLYCGAVSIALLVVGTLFARQAWLAIAGGILPLMYYHLIYLGPRAKTGGLGQSAIDSVYYFGFLVTVAALSISAISIAVHGASANLTTVVYQFGAGLVATAYAVIARMHLSSSATVLDATSPEALMDRYMKRSLELVDNAEAANARMHEYVQMVMQRTAEFDKATRNRTERVMLETAGVFAREFKATLDEARAGLKEVREVATDLSMRTLRADVARGMTQMLQTLTRVNASLDELATHARQSAQGAKDAVRTSSELDAALGRLRQNVDALSGENGAFPRSVAALAMASDALEHGSEAMDGTVGSLKDAAESVQAVAPAFQSLRTISKKVQQQLTTLEQVTNRLDESLKPVGAAAENVRALTQGLSDLADVLPPLATHAKSLTSELGQAEMSTHRLNEHLSALPNRSAALTALSDQVAGVLTQVTTGLTTLTSSAGSLSGTTTEIATLSEGVAELVTHVRSLLTIVDGLQRGLTGLTATAQTADRTLETSSQTVTSVLAATASRIEEDLRRSTQAAGLLTERLVQVAQTIIDRTRQQQGRPT